MAVEFRNNTDAKINSIYRPSEKIQRDRRHVYSRFADMKNGRNVRGIDLERIWEKAEKQYESWRTQSDPDNWQSNIVSPLTTTIVERALAEMDGQVVRPRISGDGPEDKPKAKLMKHIVDYTWTKGDADITMSEVLKDILVYGKGIWQEDFFIDKREVSYLKKFDLENKIEEYEKKIIYDFNDVYGERVPLYDFFIDPNAWTINRGRYKAKDCIRRYVMDYDAFLEMFQDSIWDKEGAVKYVKPGQRSDYYQFYQPSNGVTSNEVEVYFYWGRVPDKLIIVANDVVIRDGPNPYRHKRLPFAEGNDVKRTLGFWPRGEPELLSSIQDELTTMKRMRLDKQHMDLLKPTFVSNRELMEEDENIVHPGAFIPVDDPSSVKQPQYSDINPSSYREEELLKEEGREVTGVINPSPSGTATGAAIDKESTMKIIQHKLLGISREMATEITRLRVSNIVQFYSMPNAEKIIGKEGSDNYRRIVTKDIALEVGKNGDLLEKKAKGDNYFDVTPELIIPYYGSYNIVLSAEPSLPLSKPMRQQKANEFLSQPIVASAFESGYWDSNKAADMLAEINDFNPDDFKTESSEEEAPLVDEQVLIELANRENEALMSGKELPGTPYAPRAHTELHLAYMGSEDFKRAVKGDPEGAVARAFTRHILEESRAQAARDAGSPEGDLKGTGRVGGPTTQGEITDEGPSIQAGDLKAMNPNKIVGSEQVPRGVK